MCDPPSIWDPPDAMWTAYNPNCSLAFLEEVNPQFQYVNTATLVMCLLLFVLSSFSLIVNVGYRHEGRHRDPYALFHSLHCVFAITALLSVSVAYAGFTLEVSVGIFTVSHILFVAMCGCALLHTFCVVRHMTKHSASRRIPSLGGELTRSERLAAAGAFVVIVIVYWTAFCLDRISTPAQQKDQFFNGGSPDQPDHVHVYWRLFIAMACVRLLICVPAFVLWARLLITFKSVFKMSGIGIRAARTLAVYLLMALTLSLSSVADFALNLTMRLATADYNCDAPLVKQLLWGNFVLKHVAGGFLPLFIFVAIMWKRPLLPGRKTTSVHANVYSSMSPAPAPAPASASMAAAAAAGTGPPAVPPLSSSPLPESGQTQYTALLGALPHRQYGSMVDEYLLFMDQLSDRERKRTAESSELLSSRTLTAEPE